MVQALGATHEAQQQAQQAQRARGSCGGLCRALRREANLKCLMLTLLILTCCAAVTWCRFTEVTRVTRQRVSGSPCEAGYLYIPVCFLALLYLVYLAECWHSRAQLAMQGHVQTLAEALCLVQQMRSAEPVVWWKAVCYHYVRRKRQVTRYRHGEGYMATQVYYERVNSHAAASEFQAAGCGVRDISRDLVLDPPAPVTRIRFSKGFAFSNVEAAADFEEQRARFFAEHERFDDYMEMREGLDLCGVPYFRELVVAYKDRKPWYYRPPVFWAASMLLLSWPVRLLQEYNTAHLHYQVTKLFGGNYDGAAWLSGRLSHGSTLDSGDWDSCIRENCALIPSYSEALLMEEEDDEQRSLVEPVDSSNTETTGDRGQSEAEEAGLQTHRDNLGRSTDCRAELPTLQAKRRSWGCLLRSVTSLGSAGTVGSLASASQAAEPQQLYYPSPLAERSPGDRFQGRSCSEVPARGSQLLPPSYEEALGSPPLGALGGLGALGPLSRLRRSLTDRGEAFRTTWSTTPSWGLLGEPPRAPRRASETPAQRINMETSL